MSTGPIYTPELARLLAEHEVKLNPVDSSAVRRIMEYLSEQRERGEQR